MSKLLDLGGGLHVYAQSIMETRFMHDEIFNEGCYDVDLPDRPFIVDVGGNIGMFVLYIKSKYPDAEIISFEPMPQSAAVFRQNVALHRLEGITLNEVALGSETEGNVMFAFYPMLPGNSTRYPETKVLPMVQMAEAVPQKTVDQMYKVQEVNATVERLASFLPEDRDVDLLKVDVEGAEADVLLGIAADQWPRIHQAVLEVADLDGQLEKVNGILHDAGFTTAVTQAPLTEARNVTYMVHATRT
ncbi:FkbM family methyltransferase [Streptomyces sp. SL13]|jgi:FkbM family methyltransferase|uniref:FkbM family methyltransferase n=1 Tax=Streptantibioticus silvisoli TaxID=2705255 RepID=A0AA90K813_9ACTN|nr:FkbM family methyltransferase [Streptantibioticus silvisoli]MDI5965472.1 FkbM family methyltransferase [Streptantibioticus silvisoli]MDI5968922.1 FkbM family methyltransferase [Streptantibioticus silvisoli]